MDVRLEGLTRRFGAVTAVDALDLHIKDGEFVALLGPSGCGKTTTLLMTAGIYRPTSGAIYFGDRRVDGLLPRDRGIGMVFQNYALYPHMTVEENIGFPLELRRSVSKQERARRVRQAAEQVQVAELLARRPGQLSGGQQQRVALARALVKEPDILLLDEPLSNLDARLRHAMRGEIKRLQKDLGITSIFVTHDQLEALSMADRVALMVNGRLAAYGAPDELYDRPRNLFVAEFIGNPPMNFLPAELTRQDGTLVARADGVTLPLAAELASRVPGNGAVHPVTLGVRPEHVEITAVGAGTSGDFTDGQPSGASADAARSGADATRPGRGAGDGRHATGEVYVVEPMGREQVVDVRLGERSLQAIAPAGLPVAIGDRVGLRFDPTRLHLFDPSGGDRLA